MLTVLGMREVGISKGNHDPRPFGSSNFVIIKITTISKQTE